MQAGEEQVRLRGEDPKQEEKERSERLAAVADPPEASVQVGAAPLVSAGIAAMYDLQGLSPRQPQDCCGAQFVCASAAGLLR